MIGFGNIPEGTNLRPALTTIGQDPARMSRVGRRLFDRIGGDASSPRKLLFPSTVIWRDSA
ncbi:MAG TPA: substrate-binding domain-containing protein [Candidatus Dormibacteraeota bacterium]|nr:substrate-binding domain-containing protein [Candidatus Dormibacteraeota bacterium]